MTKHATHNLHVLLPDAIYRRLSIEAQRSNRTATELAREAIDRWLTEQQRLLVHEAIAEYAWDTAGSTVDLDEPLEAAGIESLLALDVSATEDQRS